MRWAVLGAAVGAMIVLLGTVWFSPFAILADGGTYASPRELITFVSPAEKGQQLLLIDAAQRVLAVYHIEGATGKVALKSVRQFHWDLQIADFNGEKPLPREIRQMLEHK